MATLTNLEIAERIHRKLKEVPEVKTLEILPNCLPGIDLTLKVIVSAPADWTLTKKLANKMFEAKWEIFEETGELPAVEWDIVEER